MSNVVSVRPEGHERAVVREETPITTELNRILSLLRDALPRDASVSFSFEGKLLVHIDVPKREDVILLEAALPKLEDGLFHNLSRAATPQRRFFHRVTAVVNS